MSSIIAIVVTIVLVFLFLFISTIFLRLGASFAGVPKHKNTLLRAVAILYVTW